MCLTCQMNLSNAAALIIVPREKTSAFVGRKLRFYSQGNEDPFVHSSDRSFRKSSHEDAVLQYQPERG